ncbi:PREDICTED: target of Nesh-SH3 isoform X25 [Rhinopithecus bieti]|uniref:target of Nesh-SH3 isoform X25 n=1 Tax=Rhinopithecus bieti TaxID=61621 RepID=UPI00083BF4D9|nr:PREDICTED: target of Nesh-SH3 isoform X25 [Rhinopithecus bieti]
MFEISDALKTQLAKNETLALPAKSKTPEVEKISARSTTETPETVPRTTKPTTSGALDVSETTLASTEKPWIVPTAKTSEDSKVLQPQTATYDVFSSPTTSDEPEISESYTATSDRILDSVPPKTSRTLEQPRATLAPRETPFVPQKLEILTSPAMQPTTPAPQQTTSIPSTPKRRPRPKPPRTKPERTTSAGTITPKISKSPEPTWTTPAPSKTQFISLKPKIPLSPEVTHTKPVPEPQTLPPSQSTIGPETLGPKPSTTTLAPRKTKRPGRRPRPRPRPKTTPSPEVPKSKPALEPATIQPEPLVPTTASKPSERPKTTPRPDAPQIQPGSKPPKQLLPKPQTTAEPDMPPTKSVSEPVPFETEAPSMTIIPTTDIEPVTVRTEAPVTTLAPKTSQRTRTRRPRPKHKTTPRPETPQTKLDFGPITPGTSSAPTTTKRTRRPHPKPKTTPHPEVPQTKLAPKVSQRTRRPHPKPKTTPSPEELQTELVPATIFEPVSPIKEAPGTTFVPVTDLEPVTFRTETPATTLATKTSKGTRPPRPRPKTTPSPQAPETKPVPATVLEPVTLRPEASTTLASKTSQRTRRPRLRTKTTPRPEVPESKPVPTAELKPVTLRTETWVTTQAPKTSQRTRRPRPKTKTTPSPEVPQTKPVPVTDLEPGTLRTEAPKTMVVTTVLEPDTFRTKVPETTLAPKTQRTRRPRPRPKTTSSPEVPQNKSVSVTGFEPVVHSTDAPGITFAPTDLQTLILKPVTSPSLEMTESQPVSDVLESVTFSTESPKETIAPAKTDYVYPTAKAPLWPEEPKTEVVESVTYVSEPPETTLETSPLPSQSITLPSPDEPQTEPAPKQTPRAPPKPKTSPRPRIPQTQPVPKGPQRVTAKPKTSPSPEVSYTTPAPKDVLLPHKPDTEVSQSEPAPLETRGIPFIPMISPSPSQEELQTILEETDKSTQDRFTTKIPRTTELAKTTQAPHRFYTTVRPRTSDKPHIRPVLNRTTTRPTRPKPSGMPSGNGVGTGVKQAPKPSGADRNVSVESPHPTKKPGTRRPPLPPRPTPPRRKPLPPNNVTGKPGSAGIISSGPITIPPLRSTLRPTGTPLERIATDIKQPTVPASGEELENITDFSSSPTRETDPLGKPRFKGPHVRYLQKPDNSPCSITDSVKRFPKEDATEGNATSPPQNPPTNLTVVTVEGCPSFVILDWEKPLNDTVTEYEVISRENGSFSGKNKSIQITNQTFSTVENLKPNTSYEFQVKPKNPLGEGPVSNTVAFSTESADPRVSEPVSAGRDAIWTERPFDSDSYSECKGKQYVKRTWYKKFVGVQLCNSLRYKIYLSDSLTGKFYNIGDQRGHGEDHCQFVDSFLDGRTGQQLTSDQLPIKEGYFRAVRQEPVQFGEIGGHTQINYVQWYECGTTIPGKW